MVSTYGKLGVFLGSKHELEEKLVLYKGLRHLRYRALVEFNTFFSLFKLFAWILCSHLDMNTFNFPILSLIDRCPSLQILS